MRTLLVRALGVDWEIGLVGSGSFDMVILANSFERGGYGYLCSCLHPPLPFDNAAESWREPHGVAGATHL